MNNAMHATILPTSSLVKRIFSLRVRCWSQYSFDRNYLNAHCIIRVVASKDLRFESLECYSCIFVTARNWAVGTILNLRTTNDMTPSSTDFGAVEDNDDFG